MVLRVRPSAALVSESQYSVSRSRAPAPCVAGMCAAAGDAGCRGDSLALRLTLARSCRATAVVWRQLITAARRSRSREMCRALFSVLQVFLYISLEFNGSLSGSFELSHTLYQGYLQKARTDDLRHIIGFDDALHWAHRRQASVPKFLTRLRGGSGEFGTYNTPITFFSKNGHIDQVNITLFQFIGEA